MKTVYFVRHAKSSWADLSLRDIDRPLNQRGKRDAPFMANLIKGQGVLPDALISSTAKRAFLTAKRFAKAFDIPKKAIIKKDKIYEAYAVQVMEVIQEQPDNWKTIFIFGHNPTFTSLANAFSNEYIGNVPTCGIFRVVAAVDSWRQFSENTGKLTAFYFPKQYF